jgi:hypothetical protein
MAALFLVGCGPRWSVAFDAEPLGAMSGVWGSAPDDVWVVGGAPGTGTLMHHDGRDWMEDTPPDGDLIVWVYGFGPDDVWAVGQVGTVLHRTASGWESLDVGTTEDLWGVWGSAPDDLWMVGGNVLSNDPLLLHWDGTDVTAVPLDPAENDREANSIFKVYGQDGRTFAVGQRGLIIEWDGTAWKQMPTGPAADEDFVSLWGDANGITAVGGRSSARIATLEGDSWTTVAPSGMPGLNAVTIDDGTVLVGGVSGFVGHLDDGELVREEAPDITSHDIHAMWNDGEGTTWTVGGRFSTPYAGTAWRRR